MTDEAVIEQTIKWIKSVVIGNNFCPFAAPTLVKRSLRSVVVPEAGIEGALEILTEELHHIEFDDRVETTLIIFPNDFGVLQDFLELVELAEGVANSKKWRGVYQVAAFHPEYVFEGSDADDPANYTNRSIFPMLHILSEASITKAIEGYPSANEIPERNIELAQRKGLEHMKALRAACIG